MLRAKLFFDAKNFYRSFGGLHGVFPHADTRPKIDYNRLVRWVIEQVCGPSAIFAGAYYYAAYHESEGIGTDHFLSSLNLQPGFFVRREPSVSRGFTHTCENCGHEIVRRFRTEKRVDARLVADMIHYAAVGAYDIGILFSGDQDLVPALEAVDRHGARVYVATWGGRGLSPELRAQSFGEVDLLKGVEFFCIGGVATGPEIEDTLVPVLKEIIRAGQTLALGYVTQYYFEMKWMCPISPADRTRALAFALERGLVEGYMAPDPDRGTVRAIRLTMAGEALLSDEGRDPAPILDEETESA